MDNTYSSNRISVSNPNAIQEAKIIVQNGGTIVYPTDTLYGFGVDATNEKAINNLNHIKKRTGPISILINNLEMAFTISKLSSKQKKMVAEQLQGSNTVIVPLKTGFVHPIISGQDETIGLRIPNHNFGIDLVNQLGKPITTTSVNHSGMPPLNKVDDIMELFGSSFDLLIDAGDLPPSKGSKVIKLKETHFEIIRK